MKFEIYYLGIKEGVTYSQALTQVAKLLQIEDSAAEKIINNKNSVLSSGLNQAKADSYLKAFLNVGLDVEIRACSQTEMGFTDRPPAQDEDQTVPVFLVKNDTKQSFPVKFNGNGFEYFKIWIVNIFLSIITLGIYSAWAKVRNKQYFYANTEIDGSSFHYTAKPIAILKGRLIAVALFVVYSAANQFNPIAGLFLLLLFLLFLPWIMQRSLAFNARNSQYRNVRFNFTGTMKQATSVYMLWPALIPFTFGFIIPYVWFKKSQFVVANSQYGTQDFQFNAGAKEYYVIFMKLLAILITAIIALVLIFSVISSAAYSKESLQVLLSSVSPLFILVYVLLIAYTLTAMGNLYFNATTLLSHGFTSTLQVKNMAWLYVSNTIAIMLTLGLFIPWAKVRMAQYRASCLTMNMNGSLGQFVNAEAKKQSALGDQMGDVFDIDVSLF